MSRDRALWRASDKINQRAEMSDAAWVGIAGIAVTVALAIATAVFSLIYTLMMATLRDLSIRLARAEAKCLRYEILMEEHGWISQPRRDYPSPQPKEDR